MDDGNAEKISGFFSRISSLTAIPSTLGKYMPQLTITDNNTSSFNNIFYLVFIFLIFVYIILAASYNTGCRLYRSTPTSINQLLSIRRAALGNSVDPLPPNNMSVCSQIINNVVPYKDISKNTISLLQWRPLTVRLAGYLGGICSAKDGVFDMTKGIQVALTLGARSFVFDIDYLDKSPCQPLVIHRDSGGIMRSLNTGSIQDGMKALNKMAFSQNYDPVIIILYLRRIPPGQIQADKFLTAIATELDPITMYHLGQTEGPDFHSCGGENSLFTRDITKFQKKFIVLCNYDTTLLRQKKNPKDNLNFWINARIWKHESSPSLIGSVTPTNKGQVAQYAKIGSTNDFLTIPGSKSDASSSFHTASSSVFTVALSSLEQTLTVSQMHTLLNVLGIHCVPIDVIRLGENPEHLKALKLKDANPVPTNVVPDLTDARYDTDPLSFWTYAGWSRFNKAV